MLRNALGAAAIAALAVTSCGSPGGPHAAPHSTAATAPAAGEAASTAPAPPPQRLTRKQAARAYVRIVDPANRLIDAARSDIRDRVPFRQFAADARALAAAVRTEDGRLAAVRWPGKVQPYVTAMVGTLGPADIACALALARSGNYAAVERINAVNQDCTAAATSTIPDQIRRMLGLPPRS